VSQGSRVGNVELIALRGAAKRYRIVGPWVLADVDLAVAPGTVAVASGINGSGKSTLLRILAGASSPSRGARLVGPRLRVGYAPDGLAPPPPIPARAYLRHHVRVRAARGADAVALTAEVAASVERLDAAGLLEERLPALSKGSLQKIVLIQALLGSPSLLVLDEPFAGLDAKTQEALAALLAERRDRGAAVVVSDHRPDGPRVDADVVWRVGDGHVEAAEAAVGVGEIDRLRVPAADVDATLRDLLGRGRHILRVAPRPDGTVTIEARPGR
jgi:ABC-2 type transport system ATP-binding protein